MSDDYKADQAMIDHHLCTLRAVKDQQLRVYDYLKAEFPHDDRLRSLLNEINQKWADRSSPMAAHLGIHSINAEVGAHVDGGEAAVATGDTDVATVRDLKVWLGSYDNDAEIEIEFCAGERRIWATLDSLCAWTEPDGKPCLSLGVEAVVAELFGAGHDDDCALWQWMVHAADKCTCKSEQHR